MTKARGSGQGAAFTPFQISAQVYHSMGWSPIPLKAREKSPVPTEFTGARGAYVDELQLARWLKGSPVTVGNMAYKASNIALRLPRDVLGIDVDTYDGKVGAATLAEAESRWGALPRTWITTSRAGSENGADSGIRLFRIPQGLAWPGQVGPGIELVRWDHRYAMVYPSVHPEGRTYRWVSPKGKVVDDYAPAPAELPKLPKLWVAGLTNGEKWSARATVDMTASGMQLWLSDRPEPDAPCDAMRAHVKRVKLKLMEAGPDGGGHDNARDAVWGALRDAGMGHCGVVWALAQMRKTFLAAVGKRRGLRQAEGEWARLVQQGIEKVAAEDDLSLDDPCAEVAAGTITVVKKGAGAGGANVAATLEMTEQGNAERLADVVNGRLVWLSDAKEWMVWDETSGLWRIDDLQPERWAVKAVNSLLPYIQDETLDPAKRTALRKHYRASEKIGGIHSTLDMYRARPGVALRTTAFDRDTTAFAFPNGLLTLGKRGAKFRHLLVREDHVTLVAGAEYRPDAVNADWDTFLLRSQPSQEVREWLGRLVGYSLLGSNPARRIVVCMGDTTTGKGTFMRAVAAAFGGYGAVSNLTIFRDNQDERPRADLADALPKRIIFLDEASHSWKLHPDQVKRITGAGTISARRPFAKAAVQMEPAFAPWLMTNSVPSIEGADSALRRRLIVVPFGEMLTEAEVDMGLAERLRQEAGSAIMAWAVRGYDELMTMGVERGLAAPLDALAVRDQFTSAMSELDAFIATLCLVGAEHRETPARLADAWDFWQETNRTPQRERLTNRQFALQLNANGYVLDKEWADGKSTNYRLGLALRAGYENMVNTS